VRDSGGDLDAAIDKVSGVLSGVVSKKLRAINESRVFDELISWASDRMFLTSGICGAMARTFDERDSWDSGKQTVWQNLCEAYPDSFSDYDEQTSIASLEKLANTRNIRGCIENLNARKAEILRDSLEQLLDKYKESANKARDRILIGIKEREDAVLENDLGWTEKDIKLLQQSYKSLAPEIEDVFLETVSMWFDTVVSACQDRLSDLRQELKSAIEKLQVTETRHGIRKGEHWWSSDEPYSYPVTTVNACEVRNAIADCIESYNDSLPHYFNDQVRILVRQVTNNVQKVWSEGTAFSEDPAAVRSRVMRGVKSVVDRNYDLEYKGALFSCSATKLEGSDAEKCIDEARSFVSGLSRSFNNMLREAADDVYRKCRSCHFSRIMLEPSLWQLADMKKYIEHPEIFLEKLSQLKDEVMGVRIS